MLGRMVDVARMHAMQWRYPGLSLFELITARAVDEPSTSFCKASSAQSTMSAKEPCEYIY